jgi:class 3 adenylate cyclase
VTSVDELPIGTVTFLFTDIEGSTQLLKLPRDRYGEALEDHQRILRVAFAEHGGHEIDTQGDSFFIASCVPRTRYLLRSSVSAGWPSTPGLTTPSSGCAWAFTHVSRQWVALLAGWFRLIPASLRSRRHAVTARRLQASA